METVTIGRVIVARATFVVILSHIRQQMAAGEQTLIAFCNAYTASLALQDDRYRNVLSRMLVLNDGVGLDIALQILEGRRFPENLNGTDFVPRLLAELREPVRVFLLGATPEAVEQTGRRWAAQFRLHVVAGFHHGYFDLASEGMEVVAKINAARTDVLLVGMGNPRQEIFMDRFAAQLSCPIVMGVGALFDFESGNIPRAPVWMQKARLEWLFRLKTEPRRLWKRYFVNSAGFLLKVLELRLRRG